MVTVTSAEQSTLDRQAVVVSSTPTSSFHIGYDSVFRSHKRVYVTADAMLYAWHDSYDAILMGLETSALIGRLRLMLIGLRDALPASTADSVGPTGTPVRSWNTQSGGGHCVSDRRAQSPYFAFR